MNNTITFQSTSTMAGSGSSYTSQPMLNADGTAAMQGTTTYTAVAHPGNIRKINVYTPTTDPNAPIGDAVIPLLLCALLYTLWVVKRKKRRKA